MSVSSLVRGRWIVPDGDGAVLVDSAVLVEDDEIAAVDDWQTLCARHPQARVIGSGNTAVLPGFINAHHHSKGVSTIQHGIADMLLEPWILAHGRARRGEPRLHALLSAAEQLRSGVTSVVNVLNAGGEANAFSHAVQETMRAYDDSGMRAVTAAGFSTQSLSCRARVKTSASSSLCPRR